MSAEYHAILSFLDVLDQRLYGHGRLTVYLIGGAAITLAYDQENRTADLDLIDAPAILETIAGKESSLAKHHHVYISCLDEIIFSAPSDWRTRARPVILPKPLRHLDIRVACAEDICLGKLARLEIRDIEDIEALFAQRQLSTDTLLSRLNQNIAALKQLEYRNNVKLLFDEILNRPISFRAGRVYFKKRSSSSKN